MYLMTKIIIILRNITFLMFQFKVLTMFHEMCEYFRSFLRIFHEFCVFDLDYSFLFFISSYHFLWDARLQRYDTVKYGIHFLQFSNHDRYFSRSIFKRGTQRKGARLICKEESFIQKNHQKEVLSKSSQVFAIYIFI